MLKVDKRGRMKRIIEVNIGCLFYLMLVFRLVEGIKEKEKKINISRKIKNYSIVLLINMIYRKESCGIYIIFDSLYYWVVLYF